MASALEARADVIEATTTDLAHNAPEYDNTAETAQVESRTLKADARKTSNLTSVSGCVRGRS